MTEYADGNGVWVMAGEHAGSAGTIDHIDPDGVAVVLVPAGKQHDFPHFVTGAKLEDLQPYRPVTYEDIKRLADMVEKFVPPGKRVRVNARALADFLLKHGIQLPAKETSDD
jgi:hypothetical protein